MDTKSENLKDILSKDEDDDTKFTKLVDELRSLLHSPGGKELVDVSATCGGGLRATIEEDGVTVEFKVIKAGQNETDEEQTSDSSSEFTRYMADYRVNGELGKGAFGRVFRCTHRLDKGEYVIKMVPFNEEHHEKTLREVLALRMSQHKNVVRYYQCWIEDGAVDASSSDSTADPPEKEIKDATLFIAMEHCPRTLKDILALPLENEKIHQFSKQLLEGLSHIHENGVVHLDIKPDNLFIDHSGNLKIGDFGFAAISNSREWGVNGSSSKGGDPVYEAPELKSNLNFSENVDTYSFGLVLLEMLSAPITTVFEKTELFQKARSGILPDVEDEKLGPVLRALLEEDPNCRLTPKAILSCFF